MLTNLPERSESQVVVPVGGPQVAPRVTRRGAPGGLRGGVVRPGGGARGAQRTGAGLGRLGEGQSQGEMETFLGGR